MRNNFIEELFHGNIAPCNDSISKDKDFKKVWDRLSVTEEILSHRLDGDDKKLFDEYVKDYGFVTNVSEFYQVSDFVITKPGGAQVTECLYFERPMILIKGNGGQELENRKYLVNKGYAKSVRGRTSFNRVFEELLENDSLREKMRQNISNIEQRKSMEKLFKIIEKL